MGKELYRQGILGTDDFGLQGNPLIISKGRFMQGMLHDEAAVYDWNYGGSKIRNTALRINNFIFGIDPKIHGFNVYYYGVGKLNE